MADDVTKAAVTEAQKDASHAKETLNKESAKAAYDEVMDDCKKKHGTGSEADVAYRAALSEELKKNNVLPHLTISYLNDDQQRLKDEDGHIQRSNLGNRSQMGGNEVEKALAGNAYDDFGKISDYATNWSNDITQSDIDSGNQKEASYTHVRSAYGAPLQRLYSNKDFFNQLDSAGTGLNDKHITEQNCNEFLAKAQRGEIVGTPEQVKQMVGDATALKAAFHDDELKYNLAVMQGGGQEPFFSEQTMAGGFGYSKDDKGAEQMKSELNALNTAPADAPAAAPAEAAGPPSPERKETSKEGPKDGITTTKYDDHTTVVRDDNKKTTKTTNEQTGEVTTDYDEGPISREVKSKDGLTTYNRDGSVAVETKIDEDKYKIEVKDGKGNPDRTVICDKEGKVLELQTPDGHKLTYDKESDSYLADGEKSSIKNVKVSDSGVITYDDPEKNVRHTIGTDGKDTTEDLAAAQKKDKEAAEKAKAAPGDDEYEKADDAKKKAADEKVAEVKVMRGQGYWQVAESLLKQAGMECSVENVRALTKELQKANIDESTGAPRTVLKQGENLKLPTDGPIFHKVQAGIVRNLPKTA